MTKGLIMWLTSIAFLAASAPASAQMFGELPARYGNTSSFFFFDGRNDVRDFPANGAFPGNFAAAPFAAAIGAAGFLGSNPRHSAAPYPSKSYAVAVGAPVTTCLHRPLDGRNRAARKPRHRVLCVSP